MRILFINSIQMFGGGEVWLFRAMSALMDRGHIVSLVCRPNVPLTKRARDAGYHVHTVSMRGDCDPISIYRLWRLMRKLRIQVLCTNMDKELRIGAIAAKMAGVRAIIPRRGVDYPLKNSWAYRLTYEKLTTGILANSRSTKQALLRNSPWLNPDKIRVVYNGINPEQFTGAPKNHLKKEFNLDQKQFLIGFVGQLDERKDPVTLLTAFERLVQNSPRTRLIFVGQGPLEAELRRRSKGFSEKVIFAGFRDDISDIMKSIDVLVLPSLWEGFGIVLIEAMAAGKPVITSNCSNMPEIVQHGHDGFLVPAEQPEAITDYLRLLNEDPDLCYKMGNNGRETVRNRFSIARMTDEIETYFRYLVRTDVKAERI